MLYADARSLIETGDLISVPYESGLFWWGVKKLTGRIVHVGVAVWKGNELLVAELDGKKNVYTPLSQYRNFEVRKCPCRTKGIDESIRNMMRYKRPYNLKGIFLIGIAAIVSMKPAMAAIGAICSTFNAELYREQGWDKVPVGMLITPEQLTNLVGGEVLSVTTK